VEQLIKLTRNKRRFYQQGMRAATLIRSISIASLSPPPVILLLALAYSSAILQRQKIKHRGIQKYVSRLTEPQRSQRRHSSFWIGL